MKHIFKHILLGILSTLLLCGFSFSVYAAKDEPVYTTLRTIDLGTFNEYRYKITEQFFNLREYFEVEWELNTQILQNIAVLTDTSYKYLPDNLKNQNYKRQLLINIKKGIKSPSNEIIYVEIIKSISSYLEDVEIQSIKGSVEASPISWNAPLTVTLRWKVYDPTGTKILSGNYTWWIDNGWQRLVIGRGPSINYTFREEWKFSVFLDVTSSHKNGEKYTDVLPFRSRADIAVNEKIASLIIKVGGERVWDNDELKFNPDDAWYGLLFDATSSTPTSWAKFIRTEWDFGNGIKRTNSGSPRIERVRYWREGDYDVTLKLRTNEWKLVEKKFVISVHDPIAKIEANRQDGYIGDKFTFSAKTSGSYRDLTYNWEIIDIEKDKIVYQKSDKLFTYTFKEKWRYNVKLKVRQSSGEVDQDSYIIYITSQAPIAEFESKKPYSYKPNRVLLDASRSFDPDFSDDGNLNYDWFIDGKKVTLEQSNANGSIGYYVFDSIGTHSVNLEVTDPDGITSVKKWEVVIDSILSVEMYAFPRVIQRNSFIKFVAESPEAEVYEWDFGDGKTTGWNFDKITHTYEKSGTFEVQLKVSDANNNTNIYKRKVYVSESDTPLSVIDLELGNSEKPLYDAEACKGNGWYIVDRVQTVKFDGMESINIDGEQRGLEYSWKIWNSKFSSTPVVSHKFDEIGCFPVKLTVKSKENGATHATDIMLSVQNVKPRLSSLSVEVSNPNEDPLIVNVRALGAEDPDGVIQSYLWYYYTDTDTQPQDFRSTVSSSTSFVIPKVTGNYYFVAILKDNNEARVTSEEITWARYFTTITWDNINTPIVDLTVDDNSAIIGEEIVFTAKAQNILGQNIEKDASFSWDFDGDGFYDTQTSTPTTTYIYRKSWEFFAKVKVKYRGISSTRNITINVSNKLVADFDYFSIWNKFIFFDNSNGQVESRAWDLGDGTKKSGTYFEHTYTDGLSTHDVNLKVSEGTKLKEITKTVTKNVRNILKVRKGGLVVFTSPERDADGKIILETASQKVFVYMGESTDEAKQYIIDYDIENDTDLNGWVDDDEDNKGTASYISGDIAEIPLSMYNTQTIRVYIKDADGNIIGSEDIQIEKTYIEDVLIDPDMIIFEGVTESEKKKIETLKRILLDLPQQQKIRALSYVQKLQENWNDNTEKTRTILDFESYIFELELTNEDELITLLESLLVEGQEDQSAKQITYQALINLVPSEIVCDGGQKTCYDNILSKLDDIRNSNDTDYNKTIGKEILEIIGKTDLMTNTQKLDFKAILTSLVYGGNVKDIPTKEKQDIIDVPIEKSGWDTGWVLGLFLTVLKWLGGFILVFILIVSWFYVLYLIFNKDKSLSFSEFISKTTSFGKEDSHKDEVLKEEDDILESMESEILTDTKKSDIFSDTISVDPLATPLKEQSNTEKKEKKTNTDEVPDWLKGNFSNNEKVQNKEIKKEASKKEEEKQIKSSQKEALAEAMVLKNKKIESFDLEKDTKLISDESVPDWLKGSFDTSEQKKEKNTESKELGNVKKASKKESIENKENEPSVPDWLKGSFDTPEQKKEDKVNTKVIVSKKDESNKLASKKKKTNTSASKKWETPQKVEEKKSTRKEASSLSQKKEEKKEDKVKKEELWDDGMKVPDWLKADDDK